VLFSGRALQALGGGAYVLLAVLYLTAGLVIAAWFRRQGFGRRIRLLSAVAMASLPMAVVALQQVST